VALVPAIRCPLPDIVGDLVNYNPHIHVLAADGAFDAEGGFRVLPALPRKLLEASFRKAVLDLLCREGLVSELLAERMLAWRHTGFSVHNSVRVHARNAAGRRRLAQYMLRAPFSLEKMSYELALRNITAKWKNPPIQWHAAKAQFAIQFEDRFVMTRG